MEKTQNLIKLVPELWNSICKIVLLYCLNLIPDAVDRIKTDRWFILNIKFSSHESKEKATQQ